ncbi:MAG TPA: tetratricopeptide repeat protein [Longimicrobiales bacterium]|nr:tetratricopeptide repeat protein [Longimicrobiales bacterium]
MRARIRSLIQELRRRRVFRAAGVYIVGAFAALQGASVLVPALHLAEWTMTFLVVLALVGFPVAMGLAWVFDVVPDRDAGRLRLEETAVADAARRAEPLPRIRDSSGPRCVAVVPFLNLSTDPENEIFVDGVTEDVIAQLSKIRALKVIARTSVMPFKTRERSLREIGALLGATTLLDGSVRRIGDRVRIVAQLVDAQTEQQLWAETYDRQLTDIFAIQSDVALQIAQALETELSVDEQDRIRKEPTRSIAAYQLYLQGRQAFLRFTTDGFERAIEYFARALAGDPAYALAHVGMAMAYAELVENGVLAPDIGRPRALQAADQALRLDPGLADAHCARAHLKSLWEFDWHEAEAGFQRAIALNPNSADAHDLYGRMWAAQQRYDDALVLQRRAQELDPLAHRLDVATTLLRAGRYAEAEAETARAVDFEPEYARAHATLGWAQFKQGNTAQGLASLERAVTLSPQDTQWLAQLGQARALAGDAEGARAVLHQLEDRARSGYVTPYHFAFVYTGLGEHDRALEFLEHALEERAGAIYAIKGSFLFAPLREYAGFKALLARLNLH